MKTQKIVDVMKGDCEEMGLENSVDSAAYACPGIATAISQVSRTTHYKKRIEKHEKHIGIYSREHREDTSKMPKTYNGILYR